MAAQFNIDAFDKNDLVRLYGQISDKLSKSPRNQTIDSIADNRKGDPIQLRNDEGHSCTQILKTRPVQRMNVSPRPPVNNEEDMSEEFTRAISTEDRVKGLESFRNEVGPASMKSMDDARIETRPITCATERPEGSKTSSPFCKSPEGPMMEMNTAIVNELHGHGAFKLIRNTNQNACNEAAGDCSGNGKKIDDIRRDRPLPAVPQSNLPSARLPRPVLRSSSNSSMILDRLSSISNRAIDHCEEKFADKERNTASSDAVPIYETIGCYDEYIGSSAWNTFLRQNKYNTTTSEKTLDTLPTVISPLHRGNAEHARRSDGETLSDTSSVYSDPRMSIESQRESVYFPGYPPTKASAAHMTHSDLGANRMYQEAIAKTIQSEEKYGVQLEEICSNYFKSIGKGDEGHLKESFGDIKGLLDFHKKFLKEFRYCRTLSQLGKVLRKMENGSEIYIRDKWFKSKKTNSKSQGLSFFMPYQNWAENHLHMYRHVLNQFLDIGDPDIKLASTVIDDLIFQCDSINWLKEISNFPKLQEAGKFILKDKFRVKINRMDPRNCDVIFMEKYILCVSIETKECFWYFNTSKISMDKKGAKSLFIENSILKDKNLTMKCNDQKIIENWHYTYLRLIHKKNISNK